MDCIIIASKWCFAVCGAPKRRFRQYAPAVTKGANETDIRKARKAELQRDEAIGWVSHSPFTLAQLPKQYFCFDRIYCVLFWTGKHFQLQLSWELLRLWDYTSIWTAHFSWMFCSLCFILSENQTFTVFLFIGSSTFAQFHLVPSVHFQ